MVFHSRLTNYFWTYLRKGYRLKLNDKLVKVVVRETMYRFRRSQRLQVLLLEEYQMVDTKDKVGQFVKILVEDQGKVG